MTTIGERMMKVETKMDLIESGINRIEKKIDTFADKYVSKEEFMTCQQASKDYRQNKRFTFWETAKLFVPPMVTVALTALAMILIK